MQEKTVFELIVEGKIPCNKVLENNDFLAFHDIAPKAPIHILIIPKKHFKNFQEFDPELMAKMTSFIQELAVLLNIHESGYKLLTNCGKDSGQEVFHLHFHMLSGLKNPQK
ncbi:histidine triad nucleotide-binding protein [Campylobacter estrildidarum]|uniref:Histidine triad nucleotide-binding protein n=1 Tax=Campylobacter estrildidarum TaxID=2510189 RepID=A0A4U7BGT8_9BACT|nr:histidine triad nucleotide-binding protein [Campylobacter estrildidarum]TKX30973.1 histidine triad nucleotide-binding protein [Campylobacter estrildidarum]